MPRKPHLIRTRTTSNRAISWVLGVDRSPIPTPDRIRNEYLVGFLLAVIPVILLSVIADAVIDFGRFSVIRSAIGVLIAAALLAMRLGFVGEALDGLFFGGVAIMAGGYLWSLGDRTVAAAIFPLVILVLFAAIVIYGVYARSMLRIGFLFGAAMLFDVVDSVAENGFSMGLAAFHSRLGIFVLHILAFGLAAFLKDYYDWLVRIAEARRMMNRRLEELVSESRAAGVAKLASFSHDIRSPITGILGVHDLLATTDLDEEQKRYLRILGKSNRVLLELVESILDKDDAAGERSVTLEELLDDAIASYGAGARPKGIVIRRRVLGDLPLLPLGRADTVRVVGNLVDNALKYTESGHVTVTARRSPGAGGLDLVVADSGCGMSPQRLEEVRTGAVSADVNVSGSHGLGLAGVRRIVERAGGAVFVDSELGRGTRVTLRFPPDK